MNATGPCAGTAAIFKPAIVLLGDLSGLQVSEGAGHISGPEFLVPIRAREHGTSADDDGWKIQSCSSHQMGRHHLVTDREKDEAVELIRFDDRFNVGDRNISPGHIVDVCSGCSGTGSITKTREYKFHRRSTRLPNSFFDRFRQNVHLPCRRVDLAPTVYHSNKGAIEIFSGKARSFKEGPAKPHKIIGNSILPLFHPFFSFQVLRGSSPE
jgi:hypothetical protein